MKYWFFLINALPWLAIGLFVATTCVMMKAKSEGKELGRLFKALCWVSPVLFLLTAIIAMHSGNRSIGTTWLVLGIANTALIFANSQKESK